jgi:hypothetical protein
LLTSRRTCFKTPSIPAAHRRSLSISSSSVIRSHETLAGCKKSCRFFAHRKLLHRVCGSFVSVNSYLRTTRDEDVRPSPSPKMPLLLGFSLVSVRQDRNYLRSDS